MWLNIIQVSWKHIFSISRFCSASAPVGLVDQGLEGHLLLEAVVVLQALQSGQLGQTLKTRRGDLITWG